LHILIDSGSTRDFLDIQVAKKFGCKMEVVNPLQVTMADGNKLKIEANVKKILLDSTTQQF